MNKFIEFIKVNKWIEYAGGIAVCIGLWSGYFVDKMTILIRICQMALMLMGIAVCCLHEYLNKKTDSTKEEIERKNYVDTMSYKLSYFIMLAVYTIIIVYSAAFEKNFLMMFMLALFFINIITNSVLQKKYLKEYDKESRKD